MTTPQLAKPTCTQASEASQRLLACVILLVTVWLVYRRVLSAEFLFWDDQQLVFLNPRLQTPTLHSLASFWRETNTCGFGLFTPLSYTLWWCIARIWGLSESAFHATNLILHATNALLVLLLLELLLRARKITSTVLPATAGAMLFALHPLQVEAVAWVSGMNNLLAAMFSLLSLLFLCSSALATSRRTRWVYYGLATACLILGLLSKPTALVVPLLGWALLTLVLRRPPWRAAALMAPWAVISIPFIMAGAAAQVMVNGPYTWWMRLLVAADSYAFYWHKILLPYPLIPDYTRTPLAVTQRWLTQPLWLASLVILGLVIVSWKRGWRLPMVVAVLLGMAIAPVSGIWPFYFQIHSTVTDRYAYLAMLAPALAIALLLAGRGRRSLYLLFAAALSGLALLANRQTGIWTDSFVWTTYVIEHRPTSTIGHTVRAMALHIYGRNAEALDEIDTSLRLAPGSIDYVHDRCEILMDLGRPEDALREVLEIVRRVPGHPGVYGMLVDAADKAHNLTLAMTALEQVLKQFPENAPAHAALASAFRRAGMGNQAMEHVAKALSLDPDNALARKELLLMSSSQVRTPLDVGKLTVPAPR